jgi:MarR family transcriptional regulator, organic hydroperoxide resistance regulator
MTATTPEHALALIQQLCEVADAQNEDIADVLGESGLTKPQAGILWALAPSTPPVSMRELARKLHCDPSNITLLGDQLQAAGLVQRQPDPNDGRRRVLVLTDKGLEIWSRLLERMQQRSALFTLTLKEQNQLFGLLEKVQTNQAQLPTGFLT